MNRIVSILMLLLECLAWGDSPTTQRSILLLPDSAERAGVILATTRPAFTGSGYATAFDHADDRLVWKFTATQSGLYQIEIRYSAAMLKRYELNVNGISREDFFTTTGDAFATHAAGKVELSKGENKVELRRGWGFFDVDRIELIPTELRSLKKPPATLSDPLATPATKKLFQQLLDSYGERTLSGVISPNDAKLIKTHAGVLPAIMGGDLMDYSPTRVAHGVKPERTVEQLIDDARAGYILTMLWHWNAPMHLIDAEIERDGQKVDARWYKGFNTHATTFDLAAAMENRESAEFKAILRDIDVIAVHLKKLADAGIPILFRPLHEADGGWFWWGAKGADSFKRLWALLRTRLVEHHNLHNLIWVYTGSADWNWYPPDDQFDIIGIDFYPKDMQDPMSGIWDALQARYGEKKLIALTEFGGVPDLDAMAKLGVRWSYFVSWGGKEGPSKAEPATLKRLYQSPLIIHREN